MEVCWSVGASLGIFDTIRGADFQTRHLLLALEAGDARHIALALAGEAAYSAAPGVGNRARTAKLVESSTAIAAKIGDDHAIATARCCAGVAAYLEGRFPAARQLCDEGAAMLRERCTGVAWETFTAQLFSLWALAYSGEIAELGRRVPIALKAARERGDLYAATSVRIGLPTLARLVAGEAKAVRAEAGEAIGQWSQRGLLNQHADYLLGEGDVDLYLGDAESAHRRITEAWPELRDSVLRHIQITRVECTYQRARAAVALAASGRDASKRLAEAEADAQRLERERVGYARAFATAVRAAASAQRGQLAKALDLLDGAARAFTAEGMALHAAAARLRRARLAGASDGEAAEAWMRKQGVAVPDHVLRMLMPGFAS
jgi:hypothetical protein